MKATALLPRQNAHVETVFKKLEGARENTASLLGAAIVSRGFAVAVPKRPAKTLSDAEKSKVLSGAPQR